MPTEPKTRGPRKPRAPADPELAARVAQAEETRAGLAELRRDLLAAGNEAQAALRMALRACQRYTEAVAETRGHTDRAALTEHGVWIDGVHFEVIAPEIALVGISGRVAVALLGTHNLTEATGRG